MIFIAANPFHLPFHGLRGVVIQCVDDVDAGAVAAGGKHGLTARLQKVAGGLCRIVAAAELSQFNAVGRNHFSPGKQFVFHGCDKRIISQIATASRLDHRVDNQRHARMLLHKLHQYLHHFGISERPGFDGVDGRILGKALQLLFDQVRADGLGAIYVAGVLHGQAGEHGQRMGADGCDGLYVCLYAGATRRIQPGEHQYVGAGEAFDGRSPQNGLTTARITTASRTNTGSSLNQR